MFRPSVLLSTFGLAAQMKQIGGKELKEDGSVISKCGGATYDLCTVSRMAMNRNDGSSAVDVYERRTYNVDDDEWEDRIRTVGLTVTSKIELSLLHFIYGLLTVVVAQIQTLYRAEKAKYVIIEL